MINCPKCGAYAAAKHRIGCPEATVLVGPIECAWVDPDAGPAITWSGPAGASLYAFKEIPNIVISWSLVTNNTPRRHGIVTYG